MEHSISLRELYEHPLVAEIIEENRKLRELSEKPQVTDLKEVPLPYTIKNHILIKEGVHNGVYYPAQMLRLAVDQHEGLQVYLDHQDTKGQAALTWVGAIHNPKWSEKDKAILGDIDIVDPKYAMAIAYGAKFGLSATVDVDVQHLDGKDVATNPFFKSYSMVVDPAVRETMLNERQTLQWLTLPPPNNLRCTTLESDRISIQWDPAKCVPICGSPPETGSIYCKFNVALIGGGQPPKFHLGFDNTNIEFNDLKPGKTYYFYIQTTPASSEQATNCKPSEIISLKIKTPRISTAIPGYCKGPTELSSLSDDHTRDFKTFILSQAEKMTEELDFKADLEPALTKIDDAIRRASAMRDTSLLTTLQQIKAIVSKVCGKEYPYPKPPAPEKLSELEAKIAALEQIMHPSPNSSESSNALFAPSGNTELEAVLKENEKLKEQLNAYQREKLAARVDAILKKELALGLTSAADSEARRAELEKMDSTALDAVEYNLDRTIKILESNEDNSKPAETTPTSSSRKQELSATSSSSAKLLQMMIAEQSRATFRYGGDE